MFSTCRFNFSLKVWFLSASLYFLRFLFSALVAPWKTRKSQMFNFTHLKKKRREQKKSPLFLQFISAAVAAAATAAKLVAADSTRFPTRFLNLLPKFFSCCPYFNPPLCLILSFFFISEVAWKSSRVGSSGSRRIKHKGTKERKKGESLLAICGSFTLTLLEFCLLFHWVWVGRKFSQPKDEAERKRKRRRLGWYM